METAAQVSAASGVRSKNRMLSRYRPLFPIGRGGMGSVEVAIEKKDSGFQRIVALKRLLPETSDARHTEMFLREARLAALLSHPNVVHAFDFGEEDGELFLAMEYVEGTSLARVFSTCNASSEGNGKERLSPPLVAHILAEVCEGLHAVHELKDVDGTALNVVHRDVSPQNVMLSFDGHVKVLDFGVAKIERDPALSRTGEIKGKVGYMSPEQALGDAIDRRSDLFAVGAIMYEALTGKRMWGDGTDMDVMRKLALSEPPDLALHEPKLPNELIALYTQLIAKKPEKRPPSAIEVADALRAFVASEKLFAPQRALAERMLSLFPNEAQTRRDELAKKLEEAAPPEDAARLRDSLAPTPPTASNAPTKLAPDSDEAKEIVSNAKATFERDAALANRKNRWMWAVALVVISLFAWRVAKSNGAGKQAETAPSSPTTPSTTEPSDTTHDVAKDDVTPKIDRTKVDGVKTAKSQEQPLVPSSTTRRILARPALSTTAATTPSASSSARPYPSSSAVPDVDPRPF